MRALSLRQASRCETAKTPHCKCRCHGALHGINRAEKQTADGRTGDPLDQGFFEALPADDPHHIDDAETKKQKRRKRPRTAKIGQERPKLDFEQLPLIPPGLQQEMLGACAQCGQDEWVHRTYWAAAVGADGHPFQPKETP